MSICKHCGQAVPSQEGISVDPLRNIMTVDGVPVKLTPREAEIADFLVRHWRRTVTKVTLHTEVYGLDPNGGAEVKTLDVYISRLKRLLAPVGVTILTAWGRGWRIQRTNDPI